MSAWTSSHSLPRHSISYALDIYKCNLKKHPILHRAVCFIVLAITSVMGYIFDEGDCLSPSITRYKCTVCGADKVQDDLFSAGPGQQGTHIWETGKVEKFDEATFDVIEVEVTQCVRCNAYKE